MGFLESPISSMWAPFWVRPKHSPETSSNSLAQKVSCLMFRVRLSTSVTTTFWIKEPCFGSCYFVKKHTLENLSASSKGNIPSWVIMSPSTSFSFLVPCVLQASFVHATQLYNPLFQYELYSLGLSFLLLVSLWKMALSPSSRLVIMHHTFEHSNH